MLYVPLLGWRSYRVVVGVVTAANFPDGWSFDGVTCGTPGNYPKGADYEIGFKGKGPAYVVGILQEISENRTDAGNG